MQRVGNSKDAQALIEKFDTFLFDCDGVIWIGSNLIPKVREVLAKLRSLKKQVLFVTNNSTKSRESYAQKFKDLNIQVGVEEIFGSAYCAAYYMKHRLKFPADKKVYVIGQGGICDELKNHGIQFCGSSADKENINSITSISDLNLESNVGAVLVGFDININYKKLAKAFTFLRDPQCLFLATNADLTYPADGTVLPGTGAILACLSSASGREPIVLGKPYQTMLDCIVDKFHLVRHKTCMVGDRLDTDIAFGKMGELSTLLVLTGVTDEATLAKSSIVPDYVIDSLGDLHIL